MSYSHFTLKEREKLFVLKTNKISNRKIAEMLGKHPSSISRELKRNLTELSKDYFPNNANEKAKERRKLCKTQFKAVNKEMLCEIKQKLSQFHSPDQIVGRMQSENKQICSSETIYQMIYQNHYGMGNYLNFLRQKRRRRQKRTAIKKRRTLIPNRIGIENRPQIDKIGHWEGDTMIGKNHQGAIATFVDKVSKYLIAQLMEDKTSQLMNKICKKAFEKIGFRETFTFDNGLEFARHEELSKELGVKCYFANPYHSWERGLNEHTNGLLRQFFPKKTDFKEITEEQLEYVVNLINSRPRKSLDYRTPYEVFFEKSKFIEKSNQNIIDSLPVALQI